MRLVVDTQLPNALAQWLRAQGHDAEHVLEIGLAQSKDVAIWHYARERGAVIITKDEDFAEWVRRGRSGPAVIWLRIGNCSNRALCARMDTLFPAVVRQLEQGERLIEAR